MMNEPLAVGFVVQQRYRITKVLGQGGFGITYEAIQLGTGQTCCIKELFVTGASGRNDDGSVYSQALGGVPFHRFRSAFLEEARALAKLRSPKIVRVISVFEFHGTAYFAMDMIKGQTLNQLVLASGPITGLDALALMVSLTKAVQVVHEAGMLHKDIKPSNVMIRDNGDPVLIDFGASTDQLTSGKAITFVSANYSSPEQAAGRDVAVASDIYSLGATFYFLLTGVKPMDAKLRGNKALPLVSELNPAVTTQMASLVHLALSMDPKDRFETARDLADALIELSKIQGVVRLQSDSETRADRSEETETQKDSSKSFLGHGILIISLFFLAAWFVMRNHEPNCADEDRWEWSGEEFAISSFQGQCWVWDPLFIEDSGELALLSKKQDPIDLESEEAAYSVQREDGRELWWFNAASIEQGLARCPDGLRMPTTAELERVIAEVERGQLFEGISLPKWLGESSSVWTNNTYSGEPMAMQIIPIEDVGILSWPAEGPGLMVCLSGNEIAGCVDLMACNYDSLSTVPSDIACQFGELTPGPCDDLNDLTKADFIDERGCECVGEPKVNPEGTGPCHGEMSIEYHGREYPLVEIADRCWFAEDLKSSRTRNGEPLNEQKHFVIDDDGHYAYSPSALNDRELCPSRFHVSTESDWLSIDEELFMNRNADLLVEFEAEFDMNDLMKSQSSDLLGFEGEFLGYQERDGAGLNHLAKGQAALWWTSTKIYDEYEPVSIPFRYVELSNGTEGMMRRIEFPATDEKYFGSLRCVSSEPLLNESTVPDRYEDWGNFCYSNHTENRVVLAAQCRSSQDIPVLWLELNKEHDEYDQAFLWNRDAEGAYEILESGVNSNGQVKSYSGEQGKAIVLSIKSDDTVSCATGDFKESKWMLECISPN